MQFKMIKGQGDPKNIGGLDWKLNGKNKDGEWNGNEIRKIRTSFFK